MPKDTIQGAALATLKQDGCETAYILNDKEVYGAGLARNIEMSAQEQGLEILANEGIDPKAPNFRSLAAKMTGDGADCFVFGASRPTAPCSSTRTSWRRRRTSSCTGLTGLPRRASPIPERAASRERAAAREADRGDPGPEEYPPDGQKFFRDYEAEYGEAKPSCSVMPNR